MYKLPSLLLFSDQQQYSIHAKKNNTPQKTKKKKPAKKKKRKKNKKRRSQEKKTKTIKNLRKRKSLQRRLSQSNRSCCKTFIVGFLLLISFNRPYCFPFNTSTHIIADRSLFINISLITFCAR